MHPGVGLVKGAHHQSIVREEPAVATNGTFQSSIESAMLALTCDFNSPTDVEGTLGRVTSAAVSIIDGVDYADIMLISDGKARCVAPTDPVMVKLDATQMRHNAGPCLDAAVDASMIRCGDLESDVRWPGFSSEALAAGIRGVLSFQLFTHQGGAGALNLFSSERDSVGAEGVAVGAMLATHAAVVLMSSDRQRQFESALASRDLIGQAKGVLMAKLAVDAVRAFDLIVKQSQNTNTTVVVVAQQIIDAYATVGLDGHQRSRVGR